jgi:hypothetical protein
MVLGLHPVSIEEGMRWPLTMLSAVISFPGRMDCYGRTRAACRLPRRCVRRRRREDRSAQRHPASQTRQDSQSMPRTERSWPPPVAIDGITGNTGQSLIPSLSRDRCHPPGSWRRGQSFCGCGLWLRGRSSQAAWRWTTVATGLCAAGTSRTSGAG